jgi:hypothetical protein
MVLIVCFFILGLFEVLRWMVSAFWKAGHHHLSGGGWRMRDSMRL